LVLLGILTATEKKLDKPLEAENDRGRESRERKGQE
jgi:hypothetical protein